MSPLHHSKASRKSFLSVIILLVQLSFALSAMLAKTTDVDHETGLQHYNIMAVLNFSLLEAVIKLVSRQKLYRCD